ncbi:hypothetical protein ACFVAJ_17340 [Agromyces sp. NPDC057679]|uniref:hypothetical protein n=1 Tax=Agromyces sp. NPDC057679 TaxID=3346207 RepID=UPI00366AE758
MSYARSPSEGDVYVIGTKKDGVLWWECLGCDLVSASLVPAHTLVGYDFEAHMAKGSFCAADPGQMVTHLRLHRAVGQKVPDRAINRLSREHQEWIAKREAEFEAFNAAAREAAERRQAAAEA